jgi:hypothetical protein
MIQEFNEQLNHAEINRSAYEMTTGIDKMLGTTDLDNDRDLLAPIEGMALPQVTVRERKRKAYLLQPLSKVLTEREIPGAKGGSYYVEGDPNGADDQGNPYTLDGYAVKDLEVTVTGWSRSQSFENKRENICYSPDATTGRPTELGKAAPYGIVEGQACATCKWRFKKTAVEPDANGYCSLIRGVKGVTKTPDGEQVEVNLSFKNTSGAVGDTIHSWFTKHTRAGIFTPFPIRLSSEKPNKASYFISKVAEVK